MRIGKGLKKLFNRFAAGTVLSASLLTGSIAAANEAPAVAPATPSAAYLQPNTATSCPAYPDFQRPDGPMRRVARDRTPDPELRAQQVLLRQMGFDIGAADGLRGNSSSAAAREFLLFYAPLYNGNADKFTLDAADAAQLRTYAAQAQADARTYALHESTAAALRLAADRTGADMGTLARLAKAGGHLPGARDRGAAPDDIFKFDNPTWLYMVKTYGASYGLEFYARHITLSEQDGKTVAAVDNPFLHRQILDLKDHPRLSALMGAAYLQHRAEMPAIAPPAVAAVDETVRQQQRDLSALGFDVGKSIDGVKGDVTTIAIGEYQVLYGKGAPTGTLDAEEAAALRASAARAGTEGSYFNAPTLAAGSIRMASERTDADYGYMMELAQAESSFLHTQRAATSSATGLYQFIEGTWSDMVLRYGASHGLDDSAGQVTTYNDDLGRPQARFSNPIVRAQMLELRKNPQLAALFSADFQRENGAKEGCYVDGRLTRTDLYLAHFMGASDAVYFLSEMGRNPDASAAATFPEAAQYNTSVFYETRGGRVVRERTLSEVHDLFARKFDRDTYDNPVMMAAAPRRPQRKPSR